MHAASNTPRTPVHARQRRAGAHFRRHRGPWAPADHSVAGWSSAARVKPIRKRAIDKERRPPRPDVTTANAARGYGSNAVRSKRSTARKVVVFRRLVPGPTRRTARESALVAPPQIVGPVRDWRRYLRGASRRLPGRDLRRHRPGSPTVRVRPLCGPSIGALPPYRWSDSRSRSGGAPVDGRHGGRHQPSRPDPRAWLPIRRSPDGHAPERAEGRAPAPPGGPRHEARSVHRGPARGSPPSVAQARSRASPTVREVHSRPGLARALHTEPARSRCGRSLDAETAGDDDA